MSDYAIIETGGKQYWVEAKSVIEIELKDIPENAKEVILENVLFCRQGERLEVGTPFIRGAKVVCDFLGEVRGKKVISYRFRRRKNSRTKRGHRQNYLKLEVKEIALA